MERVEQPTIDLEPPLAAASSGPDSLSGSLTPTPLPATDPDLPPLAEPIPETPLPFRFVLLDPTNSRRLIESLVLFIVAILFLRAMAIEPFGVPTGSMAPALTGNHRCFNCPRCGYPIVVGEPSGYSNQSPKQRYPSVSCPNCGQPGIPFTKDEDILVDRLWDIAGDRLLVDKNIYQLRKPRRWEIAVFRCPSDMTKPYVKRVVGLPGEQVQIVEGDVYINGRLARKTLEECRQMHIPVFDMNYPPKDEGWTRRWKKDPAYPDGAMDLEGKTLHLDGRAGKGVWADYVHHQWDEGKSCDRMVPVMDDFVYNERQPKLHSVHDFFVEFDLTPLAGAGAFSCRINGGRSRVIAQIPIGGEPRDVRLDVENVGPVSTRLRSSLQPGKTYHIEMSFFDRRICIAIDGKEAAAHYDLATSDPPQQPDVIQVFSFGCEGVETRIANVLLWRDIYYGTAHLKDSDLPGNAIESAYTLANDEYFMMGDNSANSEDSRSWPKPGVPEDHFLGKPFLLHQPSRIGKSPFSRTREIHTIDWSRIRWIR